MDARELVGGVRQMKMLKRNMRQMEVNAMHSTRRLFQFKWRSAEGPLDGFAVWVVLVK